MVSTREWYALAETVTVRAASASAAPPPPTPPPPSASPFPSAAAPPSAAATHVLPVVSGLRVLLRAGAARDGRGGGPARDALDAHTRFREPERCLRLPGKVPRRGLGGPGCAENCRADGAGAGCRGLTRRGGRGRRRACGR